MIRIPAKRINPFPAPDPYPGLLPLLPSAVPRFRQPDKLTGRREKNGPFPAAGVPYSLMACLTAAVMPSCPDGRSYLFSRLVSLSVSVLFVRRTVVSALQRAGRPMV